MPVTSSCQAAAVILDRATVVDGRTLTIRPTSALEELKSGSPKLWYVVSYGDLVDEFGPERRPTLPFAFPYTGPAGFSAFRHWTGAGRSASRSCEGNSRN